MTKIGDQMNFNDVYCPPDTGKGLNVNGLTATISIVPLVLEFMYFA
jgi:hypothetical protein